MELQTAAWYTLARTQLAGLFGLNEGLAILEALISHQWGALWPQPVHARMEIGMVHIALPGSNSAHSASVTSAGRVSVHHINHMK